MADYQNNYQGASNMTYFKPKTEGLVMFNDDNTMLKISYYDTTIKFEIRQKNMDGRYPAPELENEIAVLVNEDKAAALNIMLDEFEKKLIDYNNDFADGKDCSEYKPYSIAVHTGNTPEKTRVFQISTGTVTDKGFVPVIYIHIGTSTDLVAARSYAFKTKLTPVLVNYDSELGTVDMQHKLGQYEVISTAIRSFVYFSSKSVCHFNKTVVNDEKLNRMENTISLIAGALNVTMPESPYQPNNRYRTNNSPFDSYGNVNSNVENTQVVVENGGDIGTLLGTQNFK